MPIKNKESLIDRLSETHSIMRATLKEIDLDMQVYEDSGWRIRDIIGHIATWDRQVAKSVRAFSHGSEYAIPDFDEDDFNSENIEGQSKLNSQQVFEEWEAARKEFKAAVQEMPLDLFPGEMLYPWGDERGTVAKLVKEMCDHDEEHHSEIVKALPDSLGS